MLSKLQKTTESGYLLVSGYIREFCSIFKISRRISFQVQLVITMFYPPNYHIFGLDADNDFNTNYTRMIWKKMEIFSLLCDNVNGIFCNSARFIIKTTLNEIYLSQNYGSCSGNSGFFQLPQHKNNKEKNNDNISIISDGKFGDHTIMVSANNKFYGFGSNTAGQYGCGQRMKNNMSNNGDTIFALKHLKRIFKDMKLSQIKCGSDHTIFLTTNGKIYCCGENKWGQIGILNNDNDPYDDKQYQLEPTLVPFLYDIIEIDVGRKHNLCLDITGNIWCFGLNAMGQLGLGRNHNDNKQYVDVAVINKYFMLNNIKIKSIQCGYDFSLCIDSNGLCYLFGSNETGQIGNGLENQYKVNIPYLLCHKKIRSASLGYNHCVLIDVNNNIYTFGANNNCQCSINCNPNNNILRPYHLEKQEIGISRRRHIYKVIAGHSTTLIITSSVLCYDSSIY